MNIVYKLNVDIDDIDTFSGLITSRIQFNTFWRYEPYINDIDTYSGLITSRKQIEDMNKINK